MSVSSKSEPKDVAIVGCGALGGLFAGLLTKAGHRVWLLCRSRKQQKAIQSGGLIINFGTRHFRVDPSACLRFGASLQDYLESICFMLVMVKAFDTDMVARSLQDRISESTPVLTFQNGIGNGETLARHLPRNPILVGSTTFGAKREGVSTVRLTGRGSCQIGVWGSGAAYRAGLRQLLPIAHLLTQAGIPTSTARDVQSVLWKKLAISAVINPLTAILRVPNGGLLEPTAEPCPEPSERGKRPGKLNGRRPEFRLELHEIASAVVEEVRTVAAKYDVQLPARALLLRDVRSVAFATASNRSSMLSDVEHGRRTEIEAINGAVARMGRKHGVSTPANSLLAGLVAASSRH